MSRRSQVGSIERSGKWYVVRFWKDVPGQERRIHASERICPVSGLGALTKAERKRRAFEIVMASGVNSPQQFAGTTVATTFREQAIMLGNANAGPSSRRRSKLGGMLQRSGSIRC
jgi:hypothetical protein